MLYDTSGLEKKSQEVLKKAKETPQFLHILKTILWPCGLCGNMFFNFQIFWISPYHNSVIIWEHILYDFYSFKFVELCFNTRSNQLVNIPCTFEKNVLLLDGKVYNCQLDHLVDTAAEVTPLLLLCLVDMSVAVKEVLRSPNIIVYLPIFPFSFPHLFP